jgi:hypothetical protein
LPGADCIRKFRLLARRWRGGEGAETQAQGGDRDVRGHCFISLLEAGMAACWWMKRLPCLDPFSGDEDQAGQAHRLHHLETLDRR